MNLYICNATTRDHHLHYRLPAGDQGRDPLKVYEQVIRAGGQIEAPHHEPDDVAYIVKQIEQYGARTSDQAAASKQFSGIIYSTTKPVNVEAIKSGLGTVDEMAIARAQEHRTTNAIASDDAIARDAQQRGESVSGLEVEVIEQVKPGADKSDRKVQKIQVEREGARGRSKKD